MRGGLRIYRPFRAGRGHQVQAIAAAADLEPLVTELRSRKNKRDEQEALIAA